ncbi:hypothetical protein B0H65DRAFT_72088 [Neurospora tetraspora]|uniref:Uncharacterized protein n=1 Tax=Neurospora tetraspora TaxID=94610 RepID=A0AAE0MX58_9PEZI|nr:hypothetical protein B0H65DRAFT_72088 [Neurospora tetraspora]
MDCETDGVVSNRLCRNCARIVGKSEIIRFVIAAHFDQFFSLSGRTRPPEKEIFFHSPTVETIMSSIASGCHLCSIISWNGDKYFWHKDQSGTASALEHSSGIIQVSVTEGWTSFGETTMSFDILTDMQTSASQMENTDQMDSVLNDRFRGLQGWERWKDGRSLGVISLRNDYGTPMTPHYAVLLRCFRLSLTVSGG